MSYEWGKAPENLKRPAELEAMGLNPDYSKRRGYVGTPGHTIYYLYDVAEATPLPPKQPRTRKAVQA